MSSKEELYLSPQVLLGIKVMVGVRVMARVRVRRRQVRLQQREVLGIARTWWHLDVEVAALLVGEEVTWLGLGLGLGLGFGFGFGFGFGLGLGLGLGFCSGVPVSSTRCCESYCSSVAESLLAAFFIRCPSSMMMYLVGCTCMCVHR